ncbi:MAG: hypothetical protein GY934_13595, partial [Gammaproteobacteria bacterium]|nr:hypothetical protein [Gammaproteobacteria bacterium]
SLNLVDSTLSLGASFTRNGTATLNFDASTDLTLTGIATWTDSSDSTLDIETLTLNGNALTMTTDLIFINTGSFDVAGDQINTQDNGLTTTSRITMIDGQITSDDGPLNFAGGVTMSLSSQLSCNGSNGTLTVGADSSFDGSSVNLSSCAVSLGANLGIASTGLDTTGDTQWDTNGFVLSWNGDSTADNDILEGPITVDSGGGLRITAGGGPGIIRDTLSLSGTLSAYADVTADDLSLDGTADVYVDSGDTLSVANTFSLPTPAQPLTLTG